MNYFLSHLFRDWTWWARLGVAVVASFNVMDILSATFAYPGFFGLWVVRGTVIGGIGGLVAYYVYWNRRDKKDGRLEALLPVFLAERRVFIEEMIAADHGFRTFCYQCRHYDNARRCCNLRLQGREVKVKLKPLDATQYCLYWNLTGHPILALTARVFKDEKVQPGDRP
jgi:hypothetical protein